MVMFLTLCCISFLCTVLSVIALGAAANDKKSPTAEPEVREAKPLTVAIGTPHFFAAGAGVAPDRPVPLDVLLHQIERHVRLEQAAAESFTNQPSSRSLHSRTTSPLAS